MVIEMAFETVMANQEGWALLSMSGDELTTHFVQQQHSNIHMDQVKMA
jgi:hypothetical protein